MTAVRAIRVLRPLRAINRVPSIRILVTLLLDTLPMLGNVLAMCSLIFSIFGIVGVQMWQGVLRSRCVAQLPGNLSANQLNISAFYQPGGSSDLVCSLPENSGDKHCTSAFIPASTAHGRECGLTYEQYSNRSNYTNVCANWNQYYTLCADMGINPLYDAVSFDNILIAWVAIFQVITLEGWTDIMYYIQDAHGFWNFIYFVVLIVIGSYFMTNLCLVVITTQFQETKQRENDLMRQSRRKHTTSTSTIGSSRYGREGCWLEILKWIGHVYRHTKRRLGKKLNIKCAEPVSKRTRVTRKKKRRKKKLVYHHHHHHHHHHHYHHHVHCPGNCQYNTVGTFCPIHDVSLPPTPNASNADFNSGASTSEPPVSGVSGNSLAESETDLSDDEDTSESSPRRCAKFRDGCASSVDSKWFMYVIMGAIFVNTLTMGIEYYGQPQKMTDVLEIFNYIFTAIFGIEMIMKLIGLGFYGYIKDAFNIFDGTIVIISVVELFGDDDSGISVLRSFRLLRVFKLVRFLPALRRQLLVMIHTMDNVMTFLALLVIFMFTASILGMNLFGGKYRFPNDEGVMETSRANFDDLFWAIVTVFQVLTQEDWNIVMYDGMRATSKWAGLYFILLMTIGNYILFNLLVAILVEGFASAPAGYDSEGNYDYPPKSPRRSSLPELFTKKCPIPELDLSSVPVTPCMSPTVTEKPNPFCPPAGRTQVFVNSRTPSENDMEKTGEDEAVTVRIQNELQMKSWGHMQVLTTLFRRTTRLLTSKFRRHAAPSQVILLARSLSLLYLPGYQARGESTASLRPTPCPRTEYQLAEINYKERLESQRLKCHSKPKVCISPTPSVMYAEQAGYDSEGNYDYPPKSPRRSSLPELFTKKCPIPELDLSSVPVTPCMSPTDNPTVDIKVPTSCCSKRADWSLYVFAPDNRFRMLNKELYQNKWFDRTVLLFILLNCVVMALEGPSVLPGSLERRVIDICMYVFLGIFTIEMMVKVIALGLWIGPDAYLRSGWNVMDGFLVVISWVDVIVTATTNGQNSILGVLRVFRALRTLRPLRVISRAPGLKIVVETLISSLKPIGNIVLIAATFFIIFGILGVQLFKGKFHYCTDATVPVTTKTECLENGGSWVNREYNFDNLAKALLTLFVFSTKDGWVNIMYDGIDAVGIDKQPIRNHARYNVIYFVGFLLLAGFVVLNMLVGVVVENFQKCRTLIEMEKKIDEEKKNKKEEKMRREIAEDEALSEHYPRPRKFIHAVCTHGYFDLGIAAVIALNVLCMALEHYQQPDGLTAFLKCANYVFTAVFILEAILKIFALGIKRYIKDRWNQLDMLIVILSIVGIALEEMTMELPINPTIIRVMRVLRIARVLKLLKTAEGIRKLLDTVAQALPQVGNLGMLFLLMFFIFSALGIELFGKIDCEKPGITCQGMDEHANFRSFGIAMLTLFRISTGDNWNGILKDTISPDVCRVNPEIDCSMLEHVAPIYFAVFVLATQFVLLNVVVAVLMKHLEEAKDTKTPVNTPPLSSSSRESSKDNNGASLKVPSSDRKVSFDDEADNYSKPESRSSRCLPMVAVNGQGYNSFDNEFGLQGITRQDAIKPPAMLSRSAPSLRPAITDRRRPTSAKPSIESSRMVGSTGSLTRLSPLIGRRTKSQGKHQEEAGGPELTFTPSWDSGLKPDSIGGQVEPRTMSPRAPIYTMSEDSDLYDSNLDTDGGSDVRAFSPRPSLKSTSGSSESEDAQYRHKMPPALRSGAELAWGTPDAQEFDSNEGRPSSSKSAPVGAEVGENVQLQNMRPATATEDKSHRMQSYV
ncbi:predicted protein [Nematostella vectensis]|uniref:Ion transport domain-containing protein n=1 Tax=Nematostella vectensis TaxID=45351 RepID=A7SHI0_NEMVE|nr:predicted protein [Nematostella vectensis]|eukprot:XP_001628907.1 predicted protein [Nematostella vectensis]